MAGYSEAFKSRVAKVIAKHGITGTQVWFAEHGKPCPSYVTLVKIGQEFGVEMSRGRPTKGNEVERSDKELVKARTRPNYSWRTRRSISAVIRQVGITNSPAILLEKKLPVPSFATLVKIGQEFGVKLSRGRPSKVA